MLRYGEEIPTNAHNCSDKKKQQQNKSKPHNLHMGTKPLKDVSVLL